MPQWAWEAPLPHVAYTPSWEGSRLCFKLSLATAHVLVISNILELYWNLVFTFIASSTDLAEGGGPGGEVLQQI